MTTIQQLGQKDKFLPEVDDKLHSDENVDTADLNDQEEEKMIVHNDDRQTKNQLHRFKFINGNKFNTINQSSQISIKLDSFTTISSQKTINFQELTLKSTIICLLLLSLVLVGVYKMIQGVYEIQHPQLVMEKMLTTSRMNMVRQQNSLQKVEQLKEFQRNKKIQNIQDQSNNQQLNNNDQQKEKSRKQDQSVLDKQKKDQEKQQKQNTQQIPNQQQNLQVDLIKTQQQQLQIIKQNNNNVEPNEKPTQTEEGQIIQQNIINKHQSKKQQAESELREKEQFIENYQLKSNQKQYQDQEHQLFKDDQLDKVQDKEDKNIKEINQQKTKQQNFAQKQQQQIIAQKNQALIEPTQQEKEIPKIPQRPQPPKIHQRVPPRNPPHKPQQPTISPQRAQRPANPQPLIPTPKANVTREQAIKWRQFQQMIKLPLQVEASSNKMLLQQYQYYEKKYNISKFNQLPICVVVPTYNNLQGNRYQDNLKSILQQNYTNYHVVIIDDKSQDRTGQKINQYLTTLNPRLSQKIKVIINQQRKMAMPNLRYAAMNQCQQNQLFIIVDGDDLLIGRQVFKLFSAVMQQKDYWVMWTNFLSPQGAIGYSRQYPAVHKQANNYRKAGFVMSHLRAYYTKLFRLIKDQDLQDQKGQYFHAANDVAIGIPILQMAHRHAGYLPELCYYYNMYTGLNNHKVRLREQKANDKLIRKKPRYEALKSLDFYNINQMNQKTEDLVSPINSKVQSNN